MLLKRAEGINNKSQQGLIIHFPVCLLFKVWENVLFSYHLYSEFNISELSGYLWPTFASTKADTPQLLLVGPR